MQVKYEPTVKGWSGYITVKPLPFEKRYEIFDEIGIKIDGNEVNLGAISYAALARVVQKIEVLQCDMFYEAEKKAFSSVEEMRMDSICDPVLFELAQMYMNGLRPSKN